MRLPTLAAAALPPHANGAGIARRFVMRALAVSATLLLALAAVAVLGPPAWRTALRQAAFGAPPAAEALEAMAEVCVVAPPAPYDPAAGLPLTAARAVPATARCPVCGMFPARHPAWAAQLIFSDGAVHFFDSPLSLFMYVQAVPRYSPGRRAEEIVAGYVTDHAAPRWLPWHDAAFVHGSDARGPMRAGNLPAFADSAAAQAFAARHGGVVLSAASLRQRLPADLAALAPHRHRHPPP